MYIDAMISERFWVTVSGSRGASHIRLFYPAYWGCGFWAVQRVSQSRCYYYKGYRRKNKYLLNVYSTAIYAIIAIEK